MSRAWEFAAMSPFAWTKFGTALPPLQKSVAHHCPNSRRKKAFWRRWSIAASHKRMCLIFGISKSLNLALPDTGLFSNCVYCPLKGKRKLLAIAALELSEETDLRGTPASIDWWVEMEEKYARDLKAEKRAITSKKDVEYAYVGFFGAAHDLVYQQLKEQATHLAQDAERLQAEYLEAESYAPCNCTD